MTDTPLVSHESDLQSYNHCPQELHLNRTRGPMLEERIEEIVRRAVKTALSEYQLTGAAMALVWADSVDARRLVSA